jgi:plasmanylethanolamine desaturase
VTPSRPQLLLAGVWILLAVILLLAVTLRVSRRIDRLHWWIPVGLLIGVVVADFASGLVHWAADTWGRADMPVIGRRVLLPFRVHHVNPEDILRRSFLDANGDVAAVTVPALIGLLFVPVDNEAGQIVSVAGIGGCAIGMLTNQIHQWAHRPSPPRSVRVLQALRLVLRPGDHARHHTNPFDRHYCITTGWCNAPLEAIGFFRRLETAVAALTGIRPREDEASLADGNHPGVTRRV